MGKRTKGSRRTTSRKSQVIWCRDCDAVLFSMLPLVPSLLIYRQVCREWRDRIELFNVRSVEFGGYINKLPQKRKEVVITRILNGWGSIVSLDLRECNRGVTSQTIIAMASNLPNLGSLYLHSIQGIQGLHYLLTNCKKLETLEIQLSPHISGFSVVKDRAIQLKSLSLNACASLTTTKASKLFAFCGKNIHTLRLLGATQIDSGFLVHLSTNCQLIRQLTLTHCHSFQQSSIDRLLQVLGSIIEWLDLSMTSGFGTFPDIELPMLTTLVLDNTNFSCEGLKHVLHHSPKLAHLSLKHAARVGDVGVCSFANGVSAQSIIVLDLTGTTVTEISVETIARHCPKLKFLVLDSCRGIPRQVRQEYARKRSQCSDDVLGGFFRKDVSSNLHDF